MSDRDPDKRLREIETLGSDMPVIWHDGQGVSLVKQLTSQVAGVQALHNGWAVSRGGMWLRGSAINVYCAKDEMYRRAITAILKHHMTVAGFAPIKICFYGEFYGSQAQTVVETTTLGLD